jgi:acyl-CoA ligase (AMP-forming) (exosortase A-associated)
MAFLLNQIIEDSTAHCGDNIALVHRHASLSYRELNDLTTGLAAGLRGLDPGDNARIAVYLPKQFETVIAIFGAMAAGLAALPINPMLKAAQVGHVLRDSGAEILVTSRDRAAYLAETLPDCPELKHLVIVGPSPGADERFAPVPAVHSWDDIVATSSHQPVPSRVGSDMAAILYTSGSTGRAKGVVLSHDNLLAGARSVATYLKNSQADRLLAVLPLSFDYGLSQLTTAFLVGASVTLMDYLLPRDVVDAVAAAGITGLAAVPTLWNQLAGADWPDDAKQSLRYITSSGGVMPVATTRALQSALPRTEVYLMYGLTEAFRSTYLPPDQLSQRPDSMGRAIPNARIQVVRPDGSECEPDEIGELVHGGPLVALGYWNNREKTAQRFRPAPSQRSELPLTEIAVWSGDRVRRDRDGYLYFVGRDDEMIKTSGYRVSPAEIEEVVSELPDITQVVAVGARHPEIGQAIVLVVQGEPDAIRPKDILAHCRALLPGYMVPAHIEVRPVLPRNPNGKIDRKMLADEHAHRFTRPSD